MITWKTYRPTDPVTILPPGTGMVEHPLAEKADWHLRALDGSGQTVGTVSLWWTETPHLPGESPGTLGHFQATDQAIGEGLLTRAIDEARKRGVSLLLAPMNGSTWRNYRLLTEPGTEPPFLLDLTTPAFWNPLFQSHGFQTQAEYLSTLEEPISSDLDPRLDRLTRRWSETGIEIEAPPLKDLEKTLAAIYRISSIAFRGNYLFSPLAEEDFRQLYQGIDRILDERFVLLARQGSEPVGFIFAVPNLLEKAAGHPIRTLIVKSVAVLPGRAYAGLGLDLLGRVARAARQAGFSRLIHAFMHEGNNSKNLNPATRVIRRYALLGKKLPPP